MAMPDQTDAQTPADAREAIDAFQRDYNAVDMFERSNTTDFPTP